MAKLPAIVYLAGMGGVALLGYFLYKKKEFPFNEGSIFSELKQDLSNLGPSPQGGGAPQGGQAPIGEGVTPGTIQSNPQAVDLATYQNYLQGLKAAFPDYVPNISSQTGQVIAGDPNLFQNNPINGPPVQPYPGGALMPPYTQQMYPYYRAPMIPQPGSVRPPMGPPPFPPRPMGPPPWDDMFIDYDKFGRPRKKWPKPKPTETPQSGCKIQVGSICIGYDGSINMGSGSSSSSSGSGSGISVGGLMTGGGLGGLLGGMFGGSGGSSSSGGLGSIFGGNSGSSSNNYGIGTSANSQVIKGQVNSMLDDIFSKVGISR